MNTIPSMVLKIIVLGQKTSLQTQKKAPRLDLMSTDSRNANTSIVSYDNEVFLLNIVASNVDL
jgi:hypothetical protein